MKKQQIAQPRILIIYGPTGVGKTDLALSIAAQTPSEIINMDVGQFYKPFSIGTAKPDWKHLSTSHHLFDIIEEPRNLTVVEYREMVTHLIKKITDRGNLVILVGGSGFYLHSLLFPPVHNIPLINASLSGEKSWEFLCAVDPERAKSIHKNDTYRIERALLIWQQTGQKPISLMPEYNPIADFMLLHAGRETAQLNNLINQRVLAMVNQGWIEETKKLISMTDWYNFIRKKKLIGYNEIIDFLESKQDPCSWNYMIEVVSNKTRQYAKRQRTFWRKLKRDIAQQPLRSGVAIGCIEELNLTNLNLRLYINELLQKLYR